MPAQVIRFPIERRRPHTNVVTVAFMLAPMALCLMIATRLMFSFMLVPSKNDFPEGYE